jgi:tetratricopeptide (TPR) repeat protein
MAEDQTEQALAKARVFFERAGQVAQSNNFDYAIDMYLEGIRCAPDALEEGHIALHQLALFRQTKGGRKPSVSERIKGLRGKTALERMINAEYLFAKDPDHLPYAEAILKAALAGDYRRTAKWIADLVFQANNALERPLLQTYLLLKDSYETLGLLENAVRASQFALTLRPDDKELQDEYQRLSAELTVVKGQYEQEGDFRKSIKDREAQEKLQSQESIVKTLDYRRSAVEDARNRYAQQPQLARNILDLAYSLSDLDQDGAEDEAVELLEKAYQQQNDFTFKQQAGRIRIKQFVRKIKLAQDMLEVSEDVDSVKSSIEKLQAQLADTELEHYRLCTKNYPTDVRYKYEYGVRLVDSNRYDEAIPFFQEAQRDPRHKFSAMNKIGLCFFLKGWYADAIDVLTNALKSYQLKDDDIAKDLRYNLARAYQADGNSEKALEVYRKLAQIDFAYKDVNKRVDELRSKKGETTSQ